MFLAVKHQKKMFGKVELWYYNKEIHPRRKNHNNKVEGLSLTDELGKFDIIIILSTETNLHKFGYGFIDNFYDAAFN